MLQFLLILIAAGLLYWFPIRRWFAQWGTTNTERTQVMAGDAVIPNPNSVSTHAVTVNAPPDRVWPWLAQMGSDRGGLYSYDWLDRLFGILDRPSADRVLPEFQRLSPGDKVGLGREQTTVVSAEPGRSLVLDYDAHGFRWVWQFALEPIGANQTRLITRGSEKYRPNLVTWLFMRVMEPASFIMTRRMLLGVKQRAEALRA